MFQGTITASEHDTNSYRVEFDDRTKGTQSICDLDIALIGNQVCYSKSNYFLKTRFWKYQKCPSITYESNDSSLNHRPFSRSSVSLFDDQSSEDQSSTGIETNLSEETGNLYLPIASYARCLVTLSIGTDHLISLNDAIQHKISSGKLLPNDDLIKDQHICINKLKKSLSLLDTLNSKVLQIHNILAKTNCVETIGQQNDDPCIIDDIPELIENMVTETEKVMSDLNERDIQLIALVTSELDSICGSIRKLASNKADLSLQELTLLRQRSSEIFKELCPRDKTILESTLNAHINQIVKSLEIQIVQQTN
ncbi:hypothetical protein GJ496_011533 [Pomphorhynchus laevis]|nr:hypothetical protein GJ496_011533 [Pomphorhynchus laevis]